MPLSRDHMHDYQNKAVGFVKQTPGCALWMDMGLGKSVTTLTALVDLFDEFVIARVLVIAPLRVALHTWPAEIAGWSHLQHLTYASLCETPAVRTRAMTGKEDIHIINRELVPWLVEQWGKDWPYDTVVVDESSSFKSSSSKRFKSLKKQLPRIDRMIQLTGTPASNGLLDLWSQVFLLDKGERLGRTYSGYRSHFFESDYMGYSWSLRDGSDDEIKRRLGDVCLHLSAEDYLTLPERLDNRIDVQIPAGALKQYRQLEKDFLLELEAETVTAVNAAVLTGKLLQAANGALYTESGWFELHTAKLDALESIIEEAAGEPVLIAYNFKSDAARIKQRFSQAVTVAELTDPVGQWNAGKVPILLAHPESAGHGLNLQKGGHIAVWFGLPWSLESYQQFNARLHRQGQKRPVVIHHILAKGTADSAVYNALQSKDATQSDLLETLKLKVIGAAA